MGYGIRLKVWGDYACFTRPEMKVERVSYDIITPSAARGILEAIHWKPAIRWQIDKIYVINEIKFENIRRNEVSEIIGINNLVSAANDYSKSISVNIIDARQQRASMVLKSPAYVIEAHFEMTDLAGAEDTSEKHYNIFMRRAQRGQCFHRPYFGCREFPVHFELAEEFETIDTTKDMGWMLYDIDFANGMNPVFFRAYMINGVVEVPSWKEVCNLDS